MPDPSADCFADLITPALVVDLAAMQRNIDAMALMAKGNRIALRPHAKTHKSVEIARLQLNAGAIGICCATVNELDSLAQSGIPNLLLTTPVADESKLRRLAAIAVQNNLAVVVDHHHQIHTLNDLLIARNATIDVLIDVDVGQKRTGVTGPAEAIALARLIGESKNLRFQGLQGFAGHVQHIVDASERRSGAQRVAEQLSAHAAAVREAGFSPSIVSGSGTGAVAFDCEGPYTELQVGSYVFMDADYGKVFNSGGAMPFETSLFVLATVTSINRGGEFTIDAGVKSLAFNGPTPDRILGAPSGASYRFAGDEHGIVTIPPDAAAPPLGSRVLVVTTHCDPTVNLYSQYNVIGEDGSLETWKVTGRHS